MLMLPGSQLSQMGRPEDLDKNQFDRKSEKTKNKKEKDKTKTKGMFADIHVIDLFS